MMKSNLLVTAAACALTFSLASPGSAAIIYSTVGSTYSQNFNSLPSSPTNTSLGSSPTGWTDDNAAPPAGNFSILGWYLHHPTLQTEGGANGHQRIRLGTGSANTGSFWSFGSSGSPERALGMVSSNTMSAGNEASFYGLRLVNNTGRHLASFTLSYNGEQWRDGGAATPVAQSITFDYSTSATSIEDALHAFTDVPALTFTSPTFVNTGGGGALDGNDDSLPAPVNKTAIGPIVVNAINWQPGATLWLRWSDINDGGNDHGLAIDDVQFSAEIPEPTSLLLVLLGAVGLTVLRRGR
jgi:hypothetical protein